MSDDWNLDCHWPSGFVMNPTKKQRVGYLVHFQGLNMGDFLKPDIEVFSPYNNGEVKYKEVTIDKEKGKAKVVGVIDHFYFGNGVGDPIIISAYISSENANILAAKRKTTLETTVIKKLAWWIFKFDETNKAWFEEAFPIDPTVVAGQLNAPGGSDVQLTVDSTPVKVAPNIDVNVYNMSFQVVPAANSTYALHFASSAKDNVVRNWGLKVGEQAAAAVGT